MPEAVTTVKAEQDSVFAEAFADDEEFTPEELRYSSGAVKR